MDASNPSRLGVKSRQLHVRVHVEANGTPKRHPVPRLVIFHPISPRRCHPTSPVAVRIHPLHHRTSPAAAGRPPVPPLTSPAAAINPPVLHPPNPVAVPRRRLYRRSFPAAVLLHLWSPPLHRPTSQRLLPVSVRIQPRSSTLMPKVNIPMARSCHVVDGTAMDANNPALFGVKSASTRVLVLVEDNGMNREVLQPRAQLQRPRRLPLRCLPLRSLQLRLPQPLRRQSPSLPQLSIPWLLRKPTVRLLQKM